MTTNKSPDIVRREVLELVETKGITAAATAAIAICEDPKAPAPARATALSALFRVAALGGFGREHTRETKEPHAMTPEEIDAKLAELRAKSTLARDDDPDDDIFG